MALAPSTMKINDELLGCNIIVSPLLASGFHDTSFRNITKCDFDILCPCTPCRVLRLHDCFIMKFDVDSVFDDETLSLC